MFFILLLSSYKQGYAFQDSSFVTIDAVNSTIENVFRSIEKQTGKVFYYAAADLNGKEPVSLRVRKLKLSAAVDLLLKGKNVSWKEVKGGIVIQRKRTEKNEFTIPSDSYPQIDTIPKVTIKGTVNSEEGFPLPGASIQVRGTVIGTMTNAQGQFTLAGVPSKSSLIITYTGYQMAQYSINNQETLVIRLKRATTGLDEQVIIAYGTSSRRYLTGSVGRVTSKDIEKQPVSNPLATLYGRVPGLIITQQTGVPGGNFKVEIRGQNSLRNTANNNGNIPLYIIDGIPFSPTPMTSNAALGLYPVTNYPGSSPFNSINPSDIESIEILKDADATAIYGSRGANGVVLISTKKGVQGKLSLTANIYSGVGKVTKRMELLSTKQYLEMRREAFKNDGVTQYPANAYDINGTWDTTKYTDWQKELIGGNALTKDAQLAFSGGSNNLQYRFGGGYHKETTVFPGDFSDKRTSVHISIFSTSNDRKFKSQITANYSVGTTNLLMQDLTNAAMVYSPNAPDLLDVNGNLNWPTGVTQNPLQYIKKPYDAKVNNLISNGMLQYEIIKDLIIKSNFGYTKSNREEIGKTPLSSLSPSIQLSSTNISEFGRSSVSSWIIEPQISYQRKFGSGNFSILIGSTFQNQEAETLNQTASGFTSEALMNNIAAVPNTNVANAFSYAQYRYGAIFGRINFDLSKKYLVSLTGRRDGSSRFGPGKQFANFGSIGLGWIFSSENFIRDNVEFLSFGKLRGSYGLSGNDQIGNYGFLDLYAPALSYVGQIGLAPKQLFNPNYSWEANKKFELALETGFLNDRILFSIAYYRNRSSNQLVGYPLPPTTGFTSVQSNLNATIQNTGAEFELKALIIETQKVSWSTFLNLSIPRNRLISYPNIEASSYARTYVVGEPLSIVKLYKFLGVNSQTGFYQVEDIDKNNLINSIDMQIVKFTGAKFYGGIGNSLKWKGISLDFLFQFTKQDGKGAVSIFTAPPGTNSNQPIEVLGRWKLQNEVTNFQKFVQSTGTAYSQYAGSDGAFSDASFIRLKNVSLSYSIPERIIYKLKFQSLAFYIHGQNLLTITGYDGLDPETQGGSLPPLRVLTAGIQVTL